MDSYYQEKQFLAVINKQDKLLEKGEKWEIHKKGICHKGYTAILICDNKIVLQHRKHPMFDSVYDLSFSSHQQYKGDRLQSSEEAIYQGLRREWNIKEKNQIESITFLDKIYYKAIDKKSKYIEHEVDYIYVVKVVIIPQFNPEFAYGQLIVPINNLILTLNKLMLAPWVEKIQKLPHLLK